MSDAQRQPWHPAEWELADAAALKALASGTADKHQQVRAIRWIVERAAMTYDQAFVPGSADVTAFIEGRRSVGNQIVKLVNLDLVALKKAASGRKAPTLRKANERQATLPTVE